MSGRAVEDAIQAEIVRVAREKGLFVFHIPNGKLRSAREGASLKRIGTLAGIPDLEFKLPKGKSVFVEVKSKNGTRSSVQCDVHKQLEALGNDVFTVYGLEEGLDVIDHMLYLMDQPNRGEHA